MDHYLVLGKIGEGAHGIVLKAKQVETGELVALKRVRLRKLDDGLPNVVLREVKALQEIDSKHVVKLLDVFPHGAGCVLAFEYMVSDLSKVLRVTQPHLHSSQVKKYMNMLLLGTAHCHELKIIHRDLKPANLLITSLGHLKIGDFGLARVLDAQGERPYSHQVATRWYRAPELLYGARQYDEGVDLWAIGCIFGEMLNHSPLFPGENDIDQLCVVLSVLGSPTEESWPGVSSLPDYNKISFPEIKPIPIDELVPDASPSAVELLSHFLVFASNKRIRAHQALVDPYFFTAPLPCNVIDLPHPESNE